MVPKPTAAELEKSKAAAAAAKEKKDEGEAKAKVETTGSSFVFGDSKKEGFSFGAASNNEGFGFGSFGSPSSGFGAAPPNAFGTTAAVPSSGFGAETAGFSFGSTAGEATKVAPAAGGWDCIACETENASSDNVCSVCMVPKPTAAEREKSKTVAKNEDEKKSNSNVAVVTPNSKALPSESPLSRSWRCLGEDCGTNNPASAKACIMCELPQGAVAEKTKEGEPRQEEKKEATEKKSEKKGLSAEAPAFEFGKKAVEFGSAPNFGNDVPGKSDEKKEDAAPAFVFGETAAPVFVFGGDKKDAAPAFVFGGDPSPAFVFGSDKKDEKKDDLGPPAFVFGDDKKDFGDNGPAFDFGKKDVEPAFDFGGGEKKILGSSDFVMPGFDLGVGMPMTFDAAAFSSDKTLFAVGKAAERVGDDVEKEEEEKEDDDEEEEEEENEKRDATEEGGADDEGENEDDGEGAEDGEDGEDEASAGPSTEEESGRGDAAARSHDKKGIREVKVAAPPEKEAGFGGGGGGGEDSLDIAPDAFGFNFGQPADDQPAAELSFGSSAVGDFSFGSSSSTTAPSFFNLGEVKMPDFGVFGQQQEQQQQVEEPKPVEKPAPVAAAAPKASSSGTAPPPPGERKIVKAVRRNRGAAAGPAPTPAGDESPFPELGETPAKEKQGDKHQGNSVPKKRIDF